MTNYHNSKLPQIVVRIANWEDEPAGDVKARTGLVEVRGNTGKQLRLEHIRPPKVVGFARRSPFIRCDVCLGDLTHKRGQLRIFCIGKGEERSRKRSSVLFNLLIALEQSAYNNHPTYPPSQNP